MAHIRFTIPPGGEVTIAVNGVCGPACKDLTKPFEQALGTVIEDAPTDEMNAETETEVIVEEVV